MHAMTIKSVMTAVVLAAIVCTVAGKPAKTSRLAKYTTLCKLSDPKLSQCLTSLMKDILKHSKSGIPELNIPSLEPFVIQEIDLKIFQGLGASIFGGTVQRSDKSKAFARNLIIHHSSEFDIHDLKVDIKKNEFFIDLTFPKLQIEGEYDVNLIMFNMPIKSTGPVYINATDIAVKATLNGKTIKRKNESLLLFDSIDIKVDFKDYSISIQNLFKKDQNLNRALNDILKSQKAELRKLTKPMIEELAGKMVLSMINQILTGLPIEEIFITE
uniref:Protein takeout n=2 Tax=Schizaphis graminum TaxID=13262 RepID=A0A2S2PN39_SCHGA